MRATSISCISSRLHVCELSWRASNFASERHYRYSSTLFPGVVQHYPLSSSQYFTERTGTSFFTHLCFHHEVYAFLCTHINRSFSQSISTPPSFRTTNPNNSFIIWSPTEGQTNLLQKSVKGNSERRWILHSRTSRPSSACRCFRASSDSSRT
ncbi:unnamed protein product [Chondrus crispus]|uniref:Uncharacterized protein n=1 Tax=Chondrus crispus TaxID=2769 RepID=R7QGE3_CHOCR|nr:unnamed protein product [Chondrus crispus]CDF36501.1 unnamed protein product [Chondrus crispus]|eukprot:XP_005716320.1 unnamed protein product [Chondrus crispus]